VAALIYGREKHVIDLYVWPKPEKGNVTPSVGSHVGYNLVHWSQGDMDFWAVSDLNKDELAEFVRDWVRTS
jgi:anti-sigma factor RsiW